MGYTMTPLAEFLLQFGLLLFYFGVFFPFGAWVFFHFKPSDG